MKYDIEALKRKMLVKYPFFGSVVANVFYKENRGIDTAATDGETIFYNPDYLASLSIKEQIFVLAHEVCHIAFNHILRSEGKDPKLWNIATDAVINQFLKRDGLKMAPGGVDIAEAINYDAEQLYEKLLRENHQRYQQQQNGSGLQKDISKKDVGHDTHSMWESAVKRYKEQNNNSLLNKEKSEIEKKQEELRNMGEKAAFNKNREEKKKKLDELKEEVSRQAAQAGTLNNRSLRKVTNIGTAKPLIDWRYILKETINYDVDWSYNNATLEDGIVTPNLEEQPMAETEIVLDTSISINEVLLKNFLRECKNILKHTKLKVGCFDTVFYGFHEIRTEEDIENMRFEGGGGTSFDVAINAFSRRAENKIIFTDGEATMPNKPFGAIWIVFGGKRINPKGGKVINITAKQYEKLCSYKNESEIKKIAI